MPFFIRVDGTVNGIKDWDKRLGLGNPAADTSIKDYLRFVTAEQLQARVVPRQATPFFIDNLTHFSRHIDRKLQESSQPIQRFRIARDQTYFKMAFFSGDWPGDLGHDKVPEMLRFPNDGFLFNHMWGKTLRDGDENVFRIRRNSQQVIRPIQGIESYIDVARQLLGVDLTRGYLFGPTTPDRGVDALFTSIVFAGDACNRNTAWLSFRMCDEASFIWSRPC